MQHLGKLPSLGKQIKSIYGRLHEHHDILRNRHPEIIHKEVSKSPEFASRMSERLESMSSWKYAPEPMKGLKDRLSGEHLSIRDAEGVLRHTVTAHFFV